MSEVVEDYKFMKALRKALRHRYGINCPRCPEIRPKAQPTILLPLQRCRIDGYRDPRPALTDAQYQEVANGL